MANVLVNDTSLTAIGNAIREKNGETTLYKPAEMATAITNLPSGGGGSPDPIVVTGNADNYFAYSTLATEYIRLYGNTITTENITSAS